MSCKYPLVSVVMPVYNGGTYLVEAIESILNQTFSDFEVLLIDDGSTDKSLEYITKYADSDDRIIVISRKNMGLIYSLNEGISRSKGKFIARMDADDVCMPERFEQQVKFMNNKKVDICGSHCLLIGKNNEINGLLVTPLTHDMCSLSLSFKVPFSHSSVMIRKSFLIKNKLQYGQSHYKSIEDLDLWIRMHECGALFGNIDSVLLRYRVLNDSLSRTNLISIRRESKLILKRYYKINYIKTLYILEHLPSVLNDEEKSLVVRFIFVSLLKKFNYQIFSKLMLADKKIIISTILSEITR
jgi:glycosyltransferase involved in cell wall biosynthesis